MFVYKLHFLSVILVLQFHRTLTIFNCEMKLKVDLWLDYSYFVCGMGQYTLFPIDFNGKPEIFLKHFFGCTSTQITLKFFHVSHMSHVSAMLNF